MLSCSPWVQQMKSYSSWPEETAEPPVSSPATAFTQKDDGPEALGSILATRHLQRAPPSGDCQECPEKHPLADPSLNPWHWGEGSG